MEAMAVTINDSPKPDQFICFVCRAHYDIARLDINEDQDTGIPNFCPNCGFEVRIAEKMFKEHGEQMPICPCGTRLALDCTEDPIEDDEN